jgi:hypothetical protein
MRVVVSTSPFWEVEIAGCSRALFRRFDDTANFGTDRPPLSENERLRSPFMAVSEI